MDWRNPNVKCLFSVEKQQTTNNTPGSQERFVKAIQNPMAYGLCTEADYTSKHRPISWPPGTEYQYAFCSQYRGNLTDARSTAIHEEDAELQQMIPQEQLQSLRHQEKKQLLPPIDCEGKKGAPIFRLYDPSPLPLLDKHYRGAKYHINDPVGVYVPEELSKTKQTENGKVRISNKEDNEHFFTPNYRYKDWINRPLLDIHGDMSSAELVCKLPTAPTRHWDAYNIKMGRKKKALVQTEALYKTCRLIPYPLDKDLPNQPQTKTIH